MNQGDVYIANLNPTEGSEQAGTRPVVIISGKTMNSKLPIRIVCPITTKKKSYSLCVPIEKKTARGPHGQIIPFQVRTVSTNRLQKKIGSIQKGELQQTLKVLQDVLYF